MVRITLVLVLACGLVVLTSFASSPPNLERTLTAQQELVSQSPYDAQAHNDLGNLLILAGRDAEAEETYRRAVELDPRNTGVRFNLALLLQQSGRSDEAEGAFEELLAIEPRHGWAHYQLGVLYDGRSDRSKALEHYARAFAYDPALSFASNNPHVIDNEFSTEALLMADRYRTSVATRAPRHYSDPQRIADLMLDQEPGEDDGEAAGEAGDGGRKPAGKRKGKRSAAGAAAAADPGGEGRAKKRQRDRVRQEPNEDEDEDEDDEDEDDGRSRRQVGPQSVGNRQVGRPAGNRPPAAATRPPASRKPGESPAPGSTADRQEAMEERFKALRERMRQGRGALDDGPAGDSGSDVDSATGDDGGDAPTRTRVAPRRQRYRPGSASTGRLELKLLPEPAERLAGLGDAPA